jgi:hypothetical protein
MTEIDDRDVWRAANLVLMHFDDGAVSEAQRLADECLERGDLHGFAMWRRVFEAAVELLRTEPADGERVN